MAMLITGQDCLWCVPLRFMVRPTTLPTRIRRYPIPTARRSSSQPMWFAIDVNNKKRRPRPPFLLRFANCLLHHELDGLVVAIGADGAEVDAALEVDADGVFTHLQALVELLHSLANEVDDGDVSFNILS